MSLGIYKQGQGYWVRVLTAGVAGVLIIAAAAFGWSQAGIIRLPARSWTIALSNVDGPVAQGDTVVLEFYDVQSEDPNTHTRLGSAVIESFEPGKGSSGTIVISDFQDNPDIASRTKNPVHIRDRASDADRAYIGQIGSESMTANVRGGSPTPIFPVLYLQSGVAGTILLVGAVVLYIFVGANKKSVEFLVSTDGEMKKVNWTSYKEVKGSTMVVIAATFLIAGFLFIVDTAFSSFFSFINVLER
ncbi:MAG: preprotein translocase subunit SecE [Phycisphaerales bacterium JB052]